MKSILLIGFLFVSANILSQEMVDTAVYSSYAGCYLKTFHETDSLLITQVFNEDDKLVDELRFYADGRLERYSRMVIWEKSRVVKELNITSGHWEQVKFDSIGRIVYYEEIATDSFDAIQYFNYPNGQLAQKGFHRLVPIHDVKWINDTAVGAVEYVQLDKANAQVGEWNYYYKNGVDSANGNYAYLCFVHDSVFEDDPHSVFITIWWESYPEIKTGQWNYYSREGKLIRREEWDKGNLLKRETF
jgi:hypothetical protein